MRRSSSLPRLREDPDASVAGRAAAVMGVIHAQRGQTAEAVDLLHEAVTKLAGLPGPAFARAMADLGLACLESGEKEKGLQLLHEAQARFRNEDQAADLAQSLHNEAAYFDGQGDHAQAAALRRQPATGNLLRGVEDDVKSSDGR